MRNTLAVTFAFVALFCTTGCPEKKPAEGPMERAGRGVDNAAQDTKEAAKEGAEDVKDGAENVKKDIKKKTD